VLAALRFLVGLASVREKRRRPSPMTKVFLVTEKKEGMEKKRNVL